MRLPRICRQLQRRLRHLRPSAECALVIGSSYLAFLGCWSAGGYETVLAKDMSYASRLEEGHGGSFGTWSFSGGKGEDGYIILIATTTYPVFVYGIDYKGQPGVGATRIEYPKKLAFKIVSARPNWFSATHDYGPDELIFTRKEAMPIPLLSVRVEQLKSLMATREASEASNQAAWNRDFGIAKDLQEFRGRMINSRRPS
jgi:hypothetical protein